MKCQNGIVVRHDNIVPACTYFCAYIHGCSVVVCDRFNENMGKSDMILDNNNVTHSWELNDTE